MKKTRNTLFVVALWVLLLPSAAAAEADGVFDGPHHRSSGIDRGVRGADAEQFRPRSGTPVASLPVPRDGRLSLSVEEAVLLALENNRSLGVQMFVPLIAGTFEERERAVFDTSFFAEARLSGEKIGGTGRESGDRIDARGESETYRLGVGRHFATGTHVDLSLRQSRSEAGAMEERQTAGVTLSLTQALLQGADRKANLARVRQAELDVMASLHELRGFTEALVADIENTYWDFVLAEQRVRIFQEALGVAQQQVGETERRIEAGVVAEVELAAARAELAVRRQGLIDARSRREKTRIALLRRVNPDGFHHDWSLDLEHRDSPREPAIDPDPVESHLSLGLKLRPELAESELRLERGHMELARTRSGLLPRLDLFITLGKTGYADSFGGAVSDIDGSGYEATAGMRFDWSLGNRAARSAHARAAASRAQAAASLENLRQLIVEDIHGAYIEAERTRFQIEASAQRRRLQEETARVEEAKFNVGRSTALGVALAQRDLLESRLDEINAVIGHRKARIDLYRLDGSLLARRGIEIDGVRTDDMGREGRR